MNTIGLIPFLKPSVAKNLARKMALLLAFIVFFSSWGAPLVNATVLSGIKTTQNEFHQKSRDGYSSEISYLTTFNEATENEEADDDLKLLSEFIEAFFNSFYTNSSDNNTSCRLVEKGIHRARIFLVNRNFRI